ncbi:hypothetical protein BJV77DRAFT_463083 [Russula vinacea]|nr:hypothetical protein BJV77DRAFT_463083 [Russula vinacea]
MPACLIARLNPEALCHSPPDLSCRSNSQYNPYRTHHIIDVIHFFPGRSSYLPSPSRATGLGLGHAVRSEANNNDLKCWQSFHSTAYTYDSDDREESLASRVPGCTVCGFCATVL